MIKVAFAVGEYPEPERERRCAVARSFSTSEFEVGIVPVRATPLVGSFTPAHIQIAAGPFIDAFRQAEADGYDAVVPLGVMDIGVDGGKSAVRIPVVGPAEAMLHTAAMIGERFGLIAYHDGQIPVLRAIVRRYGMESWIAGIRTTGFKLHQLKENSDASVERFIECGRRLVSEDGAEVILAMGISQCPFYIGAAEAGEKIGVPVVEGIGTPLRMAAMLAGLGLTQSPVRWVPAPAG